MPRSEPACPPESRKRHFARKLTALLSGAPQLMVAGAVARRPRAPLCASARLSSMVCLGACWQLGGCAKGSLRQHGPCADQHVSGRNTQQPVALCVAVSAVVATDAWPMSGGDIVITALCVASVIVAVIPDHSVDGCWFVSLTRLHGTYTSVGIGADAAGQKAERNWFPVSWPHRVSSAAVKQVRTLWPPCLSDVAAAAGQWPVWRTTGDDPGGCRNLCAAELREDPSSPARRASKLSTMERALRVTLGWRCGGGSPASQTPNENLPVDARPSAFGGRPTAEAATSYRAYALAPVARRGCSLSSTLRAAQRSTALLETLPAAAGFSPPGAEHQNLVETSLRSRTGLSTRAARVPHAPLLRASHSARTMEGTRPVLARESVHRQLIAARLASTL